MGLRPALLKTVAASGGIIRIAASLMTCPWVETSATTYGRTQAGARPIESRIAVPSRPLRSATPTAMTSISTVPTGGKPAKFSTKFCNHQAKPSPVNRPLTFRASSVPGTVTLEPCHASTVEAMPRTRRSRQKR